MLTNLDLLISDPVSLSFCNVSVSYTHPGQEDNVTVTAWLPVDDWNGRMLGVGGGGWVAGGPNSQSYALAAGVASGYASTTTDAGLNLGVDGSASGWALVSPGNVHLYKHDQALIGKSLIADFYGRPPDRSYWNGCSQGGRQGMMLAQRYPTLYDGIVAAAPAITWTAFAMGLFWPQLFTNLAACDGLDVVLDGVISNEYACNFNPFSVVGTEFNCTTTNTTRRISRGAAAVANATWSGPHTTDGKFLWYGPRVGSDLTGGPTQFAAAATTCDADGCVGAPLIFGAEWITLFVEKNPDFDLATVTPAQYEDIFHAGRQEFSSMVDTDDPKLSRFRDNGGKLLTYHGTSDGVIPVQGSQRYYHRVAQGDPTVDNYFRLFLAPGVSNCIGGPGGTPQTALDSLVSWVEDGTAPLRLPVSFTSDTGTTYSRFLCPYPLRARYKPGKNPILAASYICA
ncbi:Tannase/feruloyl esterase [Aspergillus carlsbadensis]|nr:Tannase/feruloyl esterase [Aspergillus carlsbadensis]